MRAAKFSRALLFVLLSTAIIAAFQDGRLLDTGGVRQMLANAGDFAPFLFVAAYALATVVFLPGSILTIVGGALFGPVAGTLYSLSGATLGATFAFLIARYLASDWVARRAGGRLAEFLKGVETEGWRFVAFVRLMPILPFNLLNYVLGVTRIPLSQYATASFIFMAPGAFAYTYLGYVGSEALAGGEGLVQKGLLAVALLGAIVFLPPLLRRLRTARAPLLAAELKQRLARGEDIVVLDVRSAKDYSGELGHIKDSLNIPLDQLAQRLPELERLRARPIAVICRTNRMSTLAVEMLRRTGFRRVYLVGDGMLGWHQQADA